MQSAVWMRATGWALPCCSSHRTPVRQAQAARFAACNAKAESFFDCATTIAVLYYLIVHVFLRKSIDKNSQALTTYRYLIQSQPKCTMWSVMLHGPESPHRCVT